MATEFTPFASLIGGMLIGVSAVILMGLNGRIAGISGIASRLLDARLGGSEERPGLFFIGGLLLAAPVYAFVNGALPTQTVSNNLPLLAIAGLLVGFGSVFGNGCTSGHGVCGLARLSSRSLVATLTFMATAFVSVYLLRHVIGG
ncbi:MAG: YeeE/YedE family protein [Litoreibacter sp.]|nr:YeeE/YedE family protein [Litoreibacter sp.]